jgi:hypothetical protein
MLRVASDDEAIADGAILLSEFACAGSSAQFALPAASAMIDARITNLLISLLLRSRLMATSESDHQHP